MGSTALTVGNGGGGPYSRITDPLTFIKEMGKSIAQSGMFGCDVPQQGEVLAMACLARRLDPMSIPQEYHLMHGRLVLRADAMLGRLSRAGGSYQIINHTPDVAEIEVEYLGRKYRERLTWAEAQLEPFVYDGKPKDIMPLLLTEEGRKKLKMSTNYATPRRRMQHLWARVCSDAVRVVAPDLVTGNYTPEEATEFTGVAIPGRIEEAPPATIEEADAKELREERAAIQEEAIDAELADAADVELQKRVAAEQQAKQSTTLADAKQEAASPPQPVFERDMSTKIDAAEEASIKELIRETVQLPGCEKLHEAVREALTSQGLKIADLSWASARVLKEKISNKQLQGMAELMLTKGA